ncbi:MAG TPA: UxaA family hydrolase [Opitutaceae bacterium]|nr:UxaA family hydrolase [Opitutaceae bacterium]
MPVRCFQVHPADNVATLLDDAAAGPVEVIGAASTGSPLNAREAIARGHKIALADLAAGTPVMKFGVRIGHATQPVARGGWVHLQNLASDLDVRSGSLDLHSGAPTDTSSAYV